MTLPFGSVRPMLARLEDRLPVRGDWLYEPKWDGFRGLLYKEGRSVRLLSRNGKELRTYFPAITRAAAQLPDCIIDGEIVAVRNGRQEFELLQGALAGDDVPAAFIAFDVLALRDEDLRDRRFEDRRKRLEEAFHVSNDLHITPQTKDVELASGWLSDLGEAGFEGVVAKNASSRYRSGERLMIKVKRWDTADLVVGGYTGPPGDPRALLLGAFDEEGVLHHVGGTTVLPADVRSVFADALRSLEGLPSFTGSQPGTNRWRSNRVDEWVSVAPLLVVEVAYNRIDSGRIRHGARLLRLRKDKDPSECLLASLVTRSLPPSLVN